ncbi:MAG TPA: amidase [Burkholderiales bacterium]|nr:amidase [Burkholderiales bacterium]
MNATKPSWPSATGAAHAIAEGAMSAEQLVEAALERIAEAEPQVQAWTYLDRDHALEQARSRDEHRSQGNPLGPLHGVPVGVKDIIDTADMPTEDGTVLHAGRTPTHDATVVALLRAAGAVILGKTVTTECAYFAPGKTRNPHNPDHTPGGSSSGSAAAVAAGMVPLAIGTQTNGSVIRPAAFCGVYGFKPTHGLVPRGGIMRLSRTLDQVGFFARSLEDIALLAEQMTGYDERDPDTAPRARIPFRDLAAQEPPMPPHFAFVKGPAWERAEPETKEAFEELAAALGERALTVELPESAANALEWHRIIMEAEMAANLDVEWERGRDKLSPQLYGLLERGRALNALDYQKAVARIPRLNEGFKEIFDRCDAILTPAAPGPAPRGLEATGDPSFCTLWTLCGMPALSLPLMEASNGLPLGVQLVGERHADARLLRTAGWLVNYLQSKE